MYQKRKIIVVVPAFNEEAHIERVVCHVPLDVDQIILVNDASADQTGQKMKALSGPRVTVLEHARNQGVGGAMVTGLQEGLRQGGELFVKVDGDDQMDLSRMTELLKPLVDEGYAYAKGNRFLHSRELERMPLARLWGNFVLTFINKLVSGYWHVFDPQNGYFAITREALELLDLDRLSKRYFFENDMLVHLNVFGLRVKDVPLPARYGGERSSMRLSQIIGTFPFLFAKRLAFRMYQKYVLRDFSPIIIYVIVGSAFMLWGLLFGGYHWYQGIVTQQLVSTGTIMLALLPFLMGFELLLQAIHLDILATPK